MLKSVWEWFIMRGYQSKCSIFLETLWSIYESLDHFIFFWYDTNMTISRMDLIHCHWPDTSWNAALRRKERGLECLPIGFYNPLRVWRCARIIIISFRLQIHVLHSYDTLKISLKSELCELKRKHNDWDRTNNKICKNWPKFVI